MSVQHIKTLTVADGADTSVVRPSDWNSSHIMSINISGNTLGSSAITGADITLVGGLNIMLSADTAASKLVVFGPSLAGFLTTAMASDASSAFAGTVGAITGGSITVNTHGVSINLPGYLTTAMQSGASASFAGTGASMTGGSITVNTNGVAINLPSYLTTAMQSGASASFAGTNAAITGGSITVNTSGLSINLPSYLTTAMQSGASASFAGTNGAMTGGSITVNTSGVSINLPNYLTTAMASGASTNFAGTGTTLSFGPGITGGITLNTAGLNLSLSEIVLSRYVPYELLPSLSAASSFGINTLGLFPLIVPSPITFGQINIIGSASVLTSAAPNTITLSISNGSTFGLTVSAAVTASRMMDIYLFSRLTGVFSTNIGTFASTRNSFVTFMSMTYQLSASDPAANSTANFSILSSYSHVISLPGITSGTLTSLNVNSTATTWGTAYMTVTGSTTASTSNTGNTTATFSSSLAGAFPSTTMFSGNRMLPYMFASSLSQGEYWVGLIQNSSSSSSSGSTGANLGAGNSLTFAINNSVMTTNAAAVFSSMGMTSTVASSLGWLGSASQATMAVAPAQGSFASTFASQSTYVNNMGQAAGVIAISNINSNVSLWRPWMEFASVRI